MVTTSGLTARLQELEAYRQQLEAALATIAQGGTSVSIDGRTVTRPNPGALRAELNATITELNRIKRLMLGSSGAFDLIQLERE